MTMNFTSVWNANLIHSRFLGPRPAALKVKILHTDPELQQAILITRDDGTEQRAEFRCRTDGTPCNGLLNGTPVDAIARWQGEELLIETRIDSGSSKALFCDCWTLAPDGRTLVMEHRNDTLVGQRVVLEKAV
jgi:hypothetical protein